MYDRESPEVNYFRENWTTSLGFRSSERGSPLDIETNLIYHSMNWNESHICNVRARETFRKRKSIFMNVLSELSEIKSILMDSIFDKSLRKISM